MAGSLHYAYKDAQLSKLQEDNLNKQMTCKRGSPLEVKPWFDGKGSGCQHNIEMQRIGK